MRAFNVQPLVGLALGLLGVAPMSVAAEPPSPEPFLAQGKAADFLPLATTFLNAHPKHEQAWKTAWDLYQMAGIAGEFKEARDARLRLVADYPESLPARHLLAEMTAQQYASVLRECFRHLDPEDQPAGLERFIRGADLGFKQYGRDFGGNGLLLQLALATGKERWAELIPRLERPDADMVRITMLAFDDKLSGKEKIERLQNVEDNDTAKAYQRILYARLSPEERDAGDVATIVAKDLLEQEEIPQAVRLLARICPKMSTLEVLPEEYPELLYGWAHAEAAQGHGAEAAGILKRLVKEAPKGVDGSDHISVKPAAKLIPIFENLDANLAAQDKIIGEVAETFRRELPELIELKVDCTDPDTGNLVAWLRLDLNTEGVEIMAEHKGKVVCALQTSAESTRVYLQNYPQIRKYAKRAGYPTLEYDIKNLPDGTGRFSFGMAMSEFGQGRLRHSLESLITSRQLLQADPRRGFARWFAMTAGVFPASVKTENGERVLTWVSADTKELDLHFVDVHVNSEQRITSVVSSDGVTLKVNYGSVANPLLALPEWPGVPVENLAEMKTEDFFRLSGQAAELVTKLIAADEAEVAAKKENEQP